MTQTRLPIGVVDCGPRPTINDKRIHAMVAKQLLPRVVGWLGKEATDREKIESDLVESLQYSHGFDGYQVAKNLERDCYWSPDSELVDILDGAHHEAYQAAKDLAKDWVSRSGLTCDLAVGTPVIIDQVYPDKNVPGVIGGIYPETAEYVVTCKGDKPGCGVVVGAERVKEAGGQSNG